jgi:hypothetical protein
MPKSSDDVRKDNQLSDVVEVSSVLENLDYRAGVVSSMLKLEKSLIKEESSIKLSIKNINSKIDIS